MSQGQAVAGPDGVRCDRAPGRIAHLKPRIESAQEKAALTAVVLLSAILRLYGLGEQGYPNQYYAATVRSMLTGWHNAYFSSFDPAGFVSVDKPPLGFWIQALTAKFLGFHPLSLLLPEAVAGIAAVVVLYVLVARGFGGAAGLIAALVLAVTPVTVATDRNNTPDSILVLLTLGAVWAGIYLVESGRLRWAVLSAALVGLAFNVKMAQAFLVLPALTVYFVMSSRLSWRRRLLTLGVAGLVLIVTSFVWIISVDSTPATQRPYVGSSTHNSELQLALQYNGLERISGVASGGNQAASPARGPLRLLDYELRSQLGWLLPLGLVSAVVGLLVLQRRTEAWRQAVLLWSGWLLTGLAFISLAGYFHPYYLATIAPALAAVTGIGVVTMWRTRRSAVRWLLSLSVLATALFQWYILRDYDAWSVRLLPALGAAAVLSVCALFLSHMRNGDPTRRLAQIVSALAIIGLCVAPGVWAGIGPWQGSSPVLPYAGPRTSAFQTSISALASRQPGQASWMLIAYLQRNRGGAQFLVGGLYADTVAPIIVDSGQAALAFGGFLGRDPILSPQQLSAMVRHKRIRYFLLEHASPSVSASVSQEPDQRLVVWVRRHCSSDHARNLPSLIDSYGVPNELYRCGR
ncbi:MAG TPA: glycosyltransferase family 39 protein [Chloroflexota bacterium]